MKNLLALSVFVVLSTSLAGCVSYNKTIETKDSGAVSFPAQENAAQQTEESAENAQRTMENVKQDLQQGADEIGRDAQNLKEEAGQNTREATEQAGETMDNLKEKLQKSAADLGKEAENMKTKAGQVAGQTAEKAQQLKENTVTHLNQSKEVLQKASSSLQDISGKVKSNLQSTEINTANAVAIKPNLGADWKVVGPSSQKKNAFKVQQLSTGQNFLVVSEKNNNTKKTIIFNADGSRQIREFSSEIQ